MVRNKAFVFYPPKRSIDKSRKTISVLQLLMAVIIHLCSLARPFFVSSALIYYNFP